MQTGRVCLFVAFSALSLRAASPSEIGDDLKHGQLLQSQGRLAEAQQQFHQALSKATAISEPPDFQVSALSNLASVEIDLAHVATAARLYNRAISLLQNSKGDRAPAIENLQIQLAELYLESGETVTAEKLVKRVIAAQEGRQSVTTPDTAFARDVLACVYAHQKKFREAEMAERRALSIMDVLGGQDDPEYAVATLHFGSFLNSQKRSADAVPYVQKALAMLRKLPVRQPAMEAAAGITLASAWSFMGRPEEALNLTEEARRTVRNYYGANHPRTASILLAEAAVLRKIGQKAAARSAQLEGERILTGKSDIGIGVTVPLEALLPERH